MKALTYRAAIYAHQSEKIKTGMCKNSSVYRFAAFTSHSV